MRRPCGGNAAVSGARSSIRKRRWSSVDFRSRPDRLALIAMRPLLVATYYRLLRPCRLSYHVALNSSGDLFPPRLCWRVDFRYLIDPITDAGEAFARCDPFDKCGCPQIYFLPRNTTIRRCFAPAIAKIYRGINCGRSAIVVT